MILIPSAQIRVAEFRVPNRDLSPFLRDSPSLPPAAGSFRGDGSDPGWAGGLAWPGPAAILPPRRRQAMAYETIEVSRLTGGCGAEITGIDLKIMSNRQWNEVQQAFVE